MFLYGLNLSVLVGNIRTELPEFIQLWYSDDFSTASVGDNIFPGIVRIEEMGLARGIYLESENHNLCGLRGLQRTLRGWKWTLWNVHIENGCDSWGGGL